MCVQAWEAKASMVSQPTTIGQPENPPFSGLSTTSLAQTASVGLDFTPLTVPELPAI